MTRTARLACLVAISFVPQQPLTPAAPQTPAPILPGASKNFAPLVNSNAQTWTEQYLDVPILGQTNAYVPKQPAGDVAIFLSGDDGWTLGVVDMARRIAARRVIVVGVNFVWMRRHEGDVACWNTATDIESVARFAEQQLGLKTYTPPTLVGYSSGATMVYAALAQGEAGAFAGGMSLGFCPDLPTARPACPAGSWQPTFDEPKHTAWLPTSTDIKKDWYLLHGLQDSECPPADTEQFVSGMAHAHYVPIDGTGHGFGRVDRWGPAFDATVAKLFPGR
jgi:hypothetical protein